VAEIWKNNSRANVARDRGTLNTLRPDPSETIGTGSAAQSFESRLTLREGTYVTPR
jgi:hypothetical protein